MDVYKVKKEVVGVQFVESEFGFVRNALRHEWAMNNIRHLSADEQNVIRRQTRLAGAAGTLMDNWRHRRQTAGQPLLFVGEQASAIYEAVEVHASHNSSVPPTVKRPTVVDCTPVDFKGHRLVTSPHVEVTNYRLTMQS